MESDRPIDGSRGFSCECNGGADIILREDGGGRDISLRFSVIL